MKYLLLFFATVVATVSTHPNGYFNQQYSYKKSSSTYNNDQLESKNDDEGYYKKQGNLDGSIPTVDQHNTENEYISPHVDGVGHAVTRYDTKDLTQEAENVFSKHNLTPDSFRNADGSLTSGSRSYSSSSSYNSKQNSGHTYRPSYGVTSSLQDVSRSLETDLSRQVQDAVQKYQREHSYSRYISTYDLQSLEQELKANLTRELQNALHTQYGNQRISGPYSYSSANNGRVSPNYDTQELTDVRENLEEHLLRQLRESVRTQTYTSSQTHRDSAEVEDLNRHQYARPVYTRTQYPVYTPTQYPQKITYNPETASSASSSSSSNSYSSGNSYRTSYIPVSYNTYTAPARISVNPAVSVTTVAQNVQNDLAKQVSEALSTYEKKYSSSAYTLTGTRPTYQVALNDLKDSLKYNITRYLQDELDRVYGNQVQRSGYLFSSGATTNANYKQEDLDNLKTQLENNLLSHLEQNFRLLENNYVTSSKQQSSLYYSSGTDYSHNGPAYSRQLTQEPNYAYIPSSSYHRTNDQTSSSSSSSSYNAQNSQLQNIRHELQDGLRYQIGEAVRRQPVTTSNQNQLSESLTEELRRNLTQQLTDSLQSHYGTQGSRGGYSYTVSANGVLSNKANYNSDDLKQLMQQLQEDLSRQLEQQLNSQKSLHQQNQYSSSAYSSYGSHNPEPYATYTKGAARKGNIKRSGYQYSASSQTGTMDEDCMQQDSPQQYGMYGLPQLTLDNIRFGQQTEDDFLGQQTEDDYQQAEHLSAAAQLANKQLSQQTVDDFQQVEQLNQQSEDDFQQFERLGQQTEDDFQRAEQLNQQSEDDFQQVEQLGQQTDAQQSEDDFQQVERLGYSQQLGQQTEDEQLNQQSEDDFQQVEPLSLAQQSQQTEEGQSEDDFQQVERLGYSQQTEGEQLSQQSEDDFQQVEQLSYPRQTEQSGQQTEDVFQQFEQLGQNVENELHQAEQPINGKLLRGDQIVDESKHDSVELSQLPEDLQHAETEQAIDDFGQLTQQVEDNHPGKLTQEVDSHYTSNDGTYHSVHPQSPYAREFRTSPTYDDFDQQAEDLIQQVQSLRQQQQQRTTSLEDAYISQNQQQSSRSLPSYIAHNEQTNEDSQVLEELPAEDRTEVVEPTIVPSFWSKLGGKMSDSYTATKDKMKGLVNRLG